MKPSDIFIAMMLFSIFVAGSSTMLVMFDDDYGTSNITAYNDTYDQMGALRGTVDNISTNVQEGKTSFADNWGIIRIPWEAAKTLFGSVGLIQDSFETFADNYGIPTWFSYGIMTIFILIVVFAVLSIFTGRNV